MARTASHRKPRTRIIESPAARRTAVGMTGAALASVTLLTQNAIAAPAPAKPSLEEVQKKVDELYHDAEAATERYNAAKESTEKQRGTVASQLDEVAKRTEKLNEARRTLGQYAAAQYRTGGIAPTATLLLADDPQEYFDQTQLMDRLTGREQEAVETFKTQQASATKKRTEASKSLETLTSSQEELKTTKAEVQSKLSEAREMLSELTAEEKARLAAIEREKELAAQREAEAAAKKAAEEEAARKAAEEEAARKEAEEKEEPAPEPPPAPAPSNSEQIIAYSKAQIGKPYVWGATGPDSFDCSGLTQAAYKSAGITLPRTTWDQVKVGTQVAKADMKPGDLIFFYDDISHVGIYAGGGQMIHAPKPGANVRYESVDYMPFHSARRV